MRQIWLPRYGAPEVLCLRNADDPAPGTGEVRIRVRAAGVNFADLLARMGLYRDAPRPPCVLGFEVAGVIDAIGDGATGLAIGDRVFATPRFGGYTDVLTVHADHVTKLPAAMSFEEAAAFPTAYLAAHHALFGLGVLREGATILVHSAAGGVGIAAIQLARTRGCRILGTASPSKHEFLRGQGCAHPLAYDAWPAQVSQLVGAAGVDLVIDAIGGSSWRDSYDVLGPGGRLVCLGASVNVTGTRRSLLAVARFFSTMPRFTPLALMNDNKQVAGFNMRRMFDRFEIFRPQLDALISLYESGQLRPHVDRSFSFEQVDAAHRWLHERKAKGKIILQP